jgi:hypothetical protein
VDSKASLDAIEKRQISFPCQNSKPGRPNPQLIAVPTELSQFLHEILLLSSNQGDERNGALSTHWEHTTYNIMFGDVNGRDHVDG